MLPPSATMVVAVTMVVALHVDELEILPSEIQSEDEETSVMGRGR